MKGSPHSKGIEMKLAGGILTLLFVMTILLAVLIAHRVRPWPDCISQVVIVKGPAGRPVECVCFDGPLSTCFDPGHSVNVRHLVRSGVIASGQEPGMVACRFCHWAKVDPGEEPSR